MKRSETYEYLFLFIHPAFAKGKESCAMFFLDYESPEIDGNILEQLLDLCLKWSKYFSFTTLNLPNSNVNAE